MTEPRPPIPGPEVDPLREIGDRVLRLPRADDVQDLVRACQDADIVRQTRIPSPYGESEAHRFVRDARRWRGAGTALALIVAERHGPLLGSVGLHLPDPATPRRGELGYWTAPWARGRGVASASARALADWALEAGFEELELSVAEDNLASIAVAHAAGFRPHSRVSGGWTRGEGPARDLLTYVRTTRSPDPPPSGER